MTNTQTTTPITTRSSQSHRTELQTFGVQTTELATDNTKWNQPSQFVIHFTNAEETIAAIEKAKNAQFRLYVKKGGNPWNKRSFGSQFAAMKRAVTKAAAQ